MPDLSNLSVLLVEDETFTATMHRDHLRETGAKVFVASNGQDAKQLMEASSTPFDVIICDLFMPVMDGFAFLRALRGGSIGGSDPETPVIIMSGANDQDSVTRAARHGIQGYVLKPASRASLEDKIIAAVGSR